MLQWNSVENLSPKILFNFHVIGDPQLIMAQCIKQLDVDLNQNIFTTCLHRTDVKTGFNMMLKESSHHSSDFTV